MWQGGGIGLHVCGVLCMTVYVGAWRGCGGGELLLFQEVCRRGGGGDEAWGRGADVGERQMSGRGGGGGGACCLGEGMRRGEEFRALEGR